MPMNSEARDLGDPNKHMRSTNIRLFISNSIFYMIRLIQNTSIAPIPAQLPSLVSTGHSECKFNFDFWIFLPSSIQIHINLTCHWSISICIIIIMYCCLYLTNFPCARLYYYTQYCHHPPKLCWDGCYRSVLNKSYHIKYRIWYEQPDVGGDFALLLQVFSTKRVDAAIVIN